MEDIDFKNEKTKRLHEKLLKNDKGNYQQYLYSTISDFFDGGVNGKPNNTSISFDCFQATELYNRANKRKIEKIFSKFVALCKNNVGKYGNLENVANENIQKIIDKIDHAYSANLIEFKINCNLKFVSHITMVLDCMGPNLLKITYNCWLSDLARYKYWLLACPNVLKELEIKRQFRIAKQILNFYKTTGNQRKRCMLQEHTHSIYKEINRYVSSIAPGIFENIFKKIPCTINISYYSPPEYIFTKNYALYIEPYHTNFYSDIINSTGQCDRYIDKVWGNAFIPLKKDIMPADDIIMKYFRTNAFLSDHKAWINIVHYIMYNQNKLIEMLKNDYYENDIFGKPLNIKEYKRKMSKIVPLLSLIKSSYGSETYSFVSLDERNNEYLMEIDDDLIISFYSDYRKRIDFLIGNIEKQVITLKEIYINKSSELNSKINTRMFWIAVFMVIMTVLQIFFQCQQKLDFKKSDEKRQEYEIPNRD